MARDVVGTSIGPYRILGLLGAGGMGEVYRAHDPRLRRDVAIKILPSSFALDDERLQRFEREARILASLDHRHIATIYGVEEVHGAKALVLELVEGLTLAERIEAAPLDLHETLTIARQIADAIEGAHEQGIIHRDLKPANIKVRGDGTVKVLDFGLARSNASPAEALAAATITAVATKEGTVMGTAAYMSPEQARGRAVDKRTDIWAFGCILFEMLAGRRAFEADGTTDTLAHVLQREPQWTRLPAATPPVLRALVGRCLRKDARDRLRDIGDARIAIDDLVTGASNQPGAAMEAARPRRASALALLAVAGLAGAAALTVDRGVRALRTPPAIPEFGGFTHFVASPAHESAPVISPDGKWVAYLSNARGPMDVWVKFVAERGEAVNLTAGHNLQVQSTVGIGGLEISPDGTQIAFAGGPPGTAPFRMSTWVIPAPLGGSPLNLLQAGQGMRWSPSGKRIAYTSPGGARGDGLIVADADGQNPKELLRREGGKHAHWLRWSPDERFLYFSHGVQTANLEPTEIYRVPVSGGPIEPVVTTVRRAVYPLPSADGRGLFFAANPDSVDAGLWWRDFKTGRDHRLTSGIGEYVMPSVSADGRRLVATVTEKRQALQRIAVRFDRPVALEPLTDGYTGDFDPCWAPDGSRLFFSSSRTGQRNIWSVRSDLSQPAPLTTGPALDERTACSPDGRQVAFVSSRVGQRGIWVVSVEGGTPRLIVRTEVVDTLSWSPDSTKLVYAVPGEKSQLTIVTVATGETKLLPTEASANSPSWSPAEDVIAYVETRDDGSGASTGAFLRFISSDGRPALRGPLDEKSFISNGGVSWSPDGRRLAALGFPGARSGYIWIFEPHGTVPFRQLLELTPDILLRGITWTPDGASLIVGHVKATGDIILAERLR